MKHDFKIMPRQFNVGIKKQIIIKDCGEIELAPDEQLTFKSPDGKEYDFARKSWGYYTTPSINGRLKRYGFKVAIVLNELTGMKFVMSVEEDKEADFRKYCREEMLKVLEWL